MSNRRGFLALIVHKPYSSSRRHPQSNVPLAPRAQATSRSRASSTFSEFLWVNALAIFYQTQVTSTGKDIPALVKPKLNFAI